MLLLFDTLEAGSVRIDWLVTDGEYLGETFFFFTVWVLATNVDLTSYSDGLLDVVRHSSSYVR